MAIFLVAWSLAVVVVAAFAVGAFARQPTRDRARRAMWLVLLALAVVGVSWLWFRA